MDVVQGGIYFYEPPASSESPQATLVTTSGSEQSGHRPWIIVSRNSVNRAHPTAVGVPLTRNLKKARQYRVLIPAAELISEVDYYTFDTSVALCDHVRVIEVDQLPTKAGRVSENALRSIGVGLAFVLDIR